MISVVDFASRIQADKYDLSCTAFHTGMQSNDDYAQGSFVILNVFFSSFFQDLVKDCAIASLSNNIGERNMSSLDVIAPFV